MNQMFPSGPTASHTGAPAVANAYSVSSPVNVIRAILFRPVSENQRFPSRPTTMPHGLGS